jgi:hypothetical protein
MIDAVELDKLFDDGENVDRYFNVADVHYPGLVEETIIVSVPATVLTLIETTANRFGLTAPELAGQWLRAAAGVSALQSA